MGLSGRLVSQISIKADVDLLHELFTNKLHRIPDICPGKVKKLDLQSGQWGTVGSVICWQYIHDGETKFAKEIIEAIDEEKKSITFNVIEGDVMAWYNTFKFIVKVDNNGEDSLVTWTFEYEKKTEDVPEPHAVMNLGLNQSKLQPQSILSISRDFTTFTTVALMPLSRVRQRSAQAGFSTLRPGFAILQRRFEFADVSSGEEGVHGDIETDQTRCAVKKRRIDGAIEVIA
ncbi:hypothetical protein DH2020_020636 [Rehmannia glutinosa]|uniref:Bet v I/Major latex protein domain-containing protein n=1 Tax=Rehmannia glutinosa TaxID=99300 RepID=A0ABR0WH74_REHGL